MKTIKKLLNNLNACSEARKWAEDKTIEQVVEQCHRGDWLLWLAKKVDIDIQLLTLAKGRCAKTVYHLMKDERSRNAVDVAIAFGEGRATRQDLDTAASAAAYAAVYAAASADTVASAADAASAASAYTAASAAAAAASADTVASAYTAADAASAYTAADAASAYTAAASADAASAYTASASAADAARVKSQQDTAQICRDTLGKELIEKVNKLINKQ